MPHRHLYGVTETMRTLLRLNIWRIAAQTVEVTDMPPEDIEKETGTRLNLHLYHAVETPHQRNAFPLDDAGPDPISRTPMPLTLYYALTAHVVTENTAVKIKDQQDLMGLAMKSLHDFPMIDDRLEMLDPQLNPPDNVQILESGMRGGRNWIEIVPRPVTPEEALNFWSATQNHTPRLTAYYEVRSTLIFPDEPSETTGIVTALALGVGAAARPTLIASSSIRTVTLPALSGGAMLSNTLSPAVAALGAPTGGNHVVLTGEALGDGTDARLVLSSPAFAALSPPVEEAIAAPASNPAWMFLFRDGRLEFDVQPELFIEAPGGFRQIRIRPGLYEIGVLRDRRLATVAGATSLTNVESNRIAVGIGPHVDGIGVGGGGRIELDISPGTIDFADAKHKLQLAIAGEVYRRVTAFLNDPTKDPGTFIAAGDTVTAEPLFDPADGATRMVRFAVNGVDAQPVWLEPGP